MNKQELQAKIEELETQIKAQKEEIDTLRGLLRVADHRKDMGLKLDRALKTLTELIESCGQKRVAEARYSLAVFETNNLLDELGKSLV